MSISDKSPANFRKPIQIMSFWGIGELIMLSLCPRDWKTLKPYGLVIPEPELQARLNSGTFERLKRFGWFPLLISGERMVSSWFWLPTPVAWWVWLNWFLVGCSLLVLLLCVIKFQNKWKSADLWIAAMVAVGLVGFSVNEFFYPDSLPSEAPAFVVLLGAVTMFSPMLVLAVCFFSLICRMTGAMLSGSDYPIAYIFSGF